MPLTTANAKKELDALIAEEMTDDWDYNRNDDSRNILIYGHIVTTRPYYEGGHWALDPEDLDFPLTPRGQRVAELLTNLDRESLTELALSLSVCPIHLVDYAICFDDQPTDCSQVRLIHPGHDT